MSDVVPHTLPDFLGLHRASRFELAKAVGMLVLESTSCGDSMGYEEAGSLIDRGELQHYIQRRYTDGTTALFKIGAGGVLTLKADS